MDNPRDPPPPWTAYQLAEQWCWDRWRELEGDPPPAHRDTDPDPGGGWKPDKMPYKAVSLQLHSGLPKAHNSVLTQIRTEKIGLVAFLHKCRVPGFASPACPCGWQWETAKHIILDCPRFSQARCQLQQRTPSTDIRRLMSDPRAAAALATWFFQLDILPQFAWAREQLPSS